VDRQESIVKKVKTALDQRSAVAIHGGNTKAFYGYPVQGEPLDISGHSGVVEYDPGELVITCRAGSRLADIKAVLAGNGQHLPFEPPAFGEQATGRSHGERIRANRPLRRPGHEKRRGL